MKNDREEILGGKPWPKHYTFVPALRVGNVVWISGTTAADETGQIGAPGDIVEQTRLIFGKFQRLLESLGASCDNIVSTTDYFTTTENYKLTADVRRQFFKTARPTSTGVLVSGLLRKGAVIEISAVAMLSGGAERQ